MSAARAAVGEETARRRTASQRLGIEPASEGLYLTFDGWSGFELDLQSFDPLRGRQRPELVAVQEVERNGEIVQRATVFVPDAALRYFLDRFERYLSEETARGNPRHASFVERIAAIRLATIEALWTDPPESFPDRDETVWWEAWLRRSDGGELDRLTAFAEAAQFRVDDRHLVFDNRIIVLVRASAAQLASALDIIDDLAELRGARTSSQFFAGLPPAEQAEWMNNLLNRTQLAGAGSPVVCVLDTGVNRGHPLIEHSLADGDTHACEPVWGTDDHHGHGTHMAGLALYGDLRSALSDSSQIVLTHELESVKVLPPVGENDPDLYGAITADAVARTEIQAPDRVRAFSMSITAGLGPIPGAPTSWSAAVDALAAGREFVPDSGELRYMDEASAGSHRLFIVSAGNVDDYQLPYLDRCDVEAVEDPAQAWNALSVGAFTELDDLTPHGTEYEGWAPVGEPGDLSPFSRTSVLFPRQWPIKPEIVLEGGNTCVAPDGSEFDWPAALGVLTTHHELAQRLLTTTNATSAATAQAGALAGALWASYPSFWPETVRALMVHSAEWTPQMQAHFENQDAQSRTARESLVRRYGFGVPSLDRAVRSATNALTLVVQDTIHPFDAGALREMHVHELPWPVDALVDLGEEEVRLRVTLSYFVEPHPTRRGWKRRFRYASHGLRFELKQPEEANDDFLKRLNKRALDEEEERPTAQDDSGAWFLGSNARNRGSLHADMWRGTAAELAARGRVAVYPVTGWWKEHRARDRSDLGARYALVISIETEAEMVDLWTPVAALVGIPVTIEL